MAEQIIWKSINEFCDSFSGQPLNTKGSFLKTYAIDLIKKLENKYDRADAETKFLLLTEISSTLFLPIVPNTDHFFSYLFNSIPDVIFSSLSKPWYHNLNIQREQLNEQQFDKVSLIYHSFLVEDIDIRLSIVKYLVALFGSGSVIFEPIKQYISSFIRNFSEANDYYNVFELESQKESFGLYNKLKDDPLLHEFAAQYIDKYKK